MLAEVLPGGNVRSLEEVREGTIDLKQFNLNVRVFFNLKWK